MSKKTTYRISPFGTGIHLHLNKPDDKFGPPVYKGKLKLEGQAAEDFAAIIDADAKAAFEEYFETGEGKDMTPGQRKKVTLYTPYDREEDDEGNPTGAILFEFKQNAKIKLKDGTVKDIPMPIHDSKDVATRALVFGGSTIRFMYAPRLIKVPATNQVGVRLDFAKVQVRKLADRSAGGGGFGVDEEGEFDGGGFGSDPEGDTGGTSSSPNGSANGDY